MFSWTPRVAAKAATGMLVLLCAAAAVSAAPLINVTYLDDAPYSVESASTIIAFDGYPTDAHVQYETATSDQQDGGGGSGGHPPNVTFALYVDLDASADANGVLPDVTPATCHDENLVPLNVTLYSNQTTAGFVIDGAALAHQSLELDKRYALCFSNATMALPHGADEEDIDASMAFSGLFLTFSRPVQFASDVAEPIGMPSMSIALPGAPMDVALWANASNRMPNTTSSAGPFVYVVMTDVACHRLYAVFQFDVVFDSANASRATASISPSDTVPMTSEGSVYKVCFLGSTVLQRTLAVFGDVSLDDESFNVEQSVVVPVLAGRTRAFTVTSGSLTNTAISESHFSTCSGSGEDMVSDALATTSSFSSSTRVLRVVGADTSELSTMSDPTAALCFMPKGFNATRVRLGVAFGAFYVNYFDSLYVNVTTGRSNLAVFSPSGSLTMNVSIVGAAPIAGSFYVSSDTSCTYPGASFDAPFSLSTWTVSVPSAWWGTGSSYLCFSYMGDRKEIQRIRVWPFRIEEVSITSVDAWYGLTSTNTGTQLFLSTDETPRVQVTGSNVGILSIGVATDSGTCMDWVSLGSGGSASLIAIALHEGNGSFCFSGNPTSDSNVYVTGRYSVVSPAAFGEGTTMYSGDGFRQYVMADGSPTTFAWTLSTLYGGSLPAETRSALYDSINIAVCSSASSSTTVAVSRQSTSSGLSTSISAATMVQGRVPLCWRLQSMPSGQEVRIAAVYAFPGLASSDPILPKQIMATRTEPLHIYLEQAPSSEVLSHVQFAIALVTGPCNGSNLNVAFQSTIGLSSSWHNTTVDVSTYDGEFFVCGSVVGTSDTNPRFVYTLGTMRAFAIVIDEAITLPASANNTTALTFLYFGSLPSATVRFRPQLTTADAMALMVVPDNSTCGSAGSDGISLFDTGSFSATTSSSSVSHSVNFALFQAGSGLRYRLCLVGPSAVMPRFTGGIVRISVVGTLGTTTTAASSTAAPVTDVNGSTVSTAMTPPPPTDANASTPDANATAVNGTTIPPTPAPPTIPNVATGITAFVGSDREYSVSGTDMDALFSWRLSFYTTAMESDANCAQPPDIAFNASVTTATNALFQLNFPATATYLGICLSAEAIQGSYQHRLLSGIAKAIPLSSFETPGGSPVTSQMQAVAGTPVRFRVNQPAGATNEFFTNVSFVAAATCGVVDVTSSTALQFALVYIDNYPYVEAPSTGTSGTYRLCVVQPKATTTRRQQYTDPAAIDSYDAGVSFTYASVEINGVALGPARNIGHFRGEELTLDITGAELLAKSSTFALTVFLDEASCASSTQTGTTSSGLSREPIAVVACDGTSVVTAKIPAASTFTTNPLHICMQTMQDSGASQRVIIDTNVTLTVSSPDALVLEDTFPPTTSIDNDFAQVPVVAVSDSRTNAVLTALPFDVEVQGTWYVLDPVKVRITSPVYTAFGTKGTANVDFASANIKLPGVFLYTYVMEFTVINRNDIAPVNSTPVTRANCYQSNPPQYAEPYTTNCVACPENTQCDGSPYLNVSGSYYRPSNLTKATFSCGIPFAGDTCLSGTPTGTCQTGSSGPRCSECEPNYGKAIDTCVACNPGTDWLVVLLVLIFLVVVLLILVYSTIGCKKSDQLPIYLKVLITHLITASTLGGTSLLLPPFLVEYFQIQKSISRPTPEFAAFDCFFGTRFYDKFIIVQIAPVAVAVCVALVLIFRACYLACERDDNAESTSNAQIDQSGIDRHRTMHGHRKSDAAAIEITEQERALQRKNSAALLRRIRKQSAFHFFMIIMVVLLFFAYPTLVEWAINVLRCDDITYEERMPDGSLQKVSNEVVYFDRSIDCASGEAEAYWLVGLILVFVWGFGIPIAAALIFLRLRASLGRVVASRMFTFIIAGYRNAVWWWEVVLMMRKFAIIAIMSFIRDPRLQALISFWVLALHLVAHMIICPYEYRTVDKMETVSLYVLCGTLNLSLLFDWVDIENKEDDTWLQIGGWALSILIIVLNVGVILWMLSLVLKEANNKFKRWVRDNRAWVSDNVCCCSEWMINHGFSGLSEEVLAPALTRANLKGSSRPAANAADGSDDDDEAPDARENLADMAKNGTTMNVMVIEDDSASDWSDEDSDSDSDTSVLMTNATNEFQLSTLDRRGFGDEPASSRVGVSFDVPEEMVEAPATGGAVGQKAGRQLAAVRRTDGVSVNVYERDRHAGTYVLGHNGDGDEMSGVYRIDELRAASPGGNVMDGVDRIAQSFEAPDSDEDGAAPSSPKLATARGETTSPHAVASCGRFSPASQGSHDQKQYTTVIRTLRVSMAALRETADTLSDDNGTLKATVEQLQKNVEQLTKQLDVSREASSKLEQQVAEQLHTIDEIQEAVRRLEQENVDLRALTGEVQDLRAENADMSMEREDLRSQLATRPKTSDHLAMTIDGWKERKEATVKERDAQMKILEIEAQLREERIQQLQAQEREEQARLVAEHLEQKRIARAAKANRPNTGPAASGGTSALPTGQAIPRLRSASGDLAVSQSLSGASTSGGRSSVMSPSGAMRKKKISFAFHARKVGRAARAFSPANLNTSAGDADTLRQMEDVGEIPTQDAAGRPVVVIHKRRTEKLEPTVRRAFSTRKIL